MFYEIHLSQCGPLSRTHWVNTGPLSCSLTLLGLSCYVKRLCRIQSSVSAWQQWWKRNAILKLPVALWSWRLVGLPKKAEFVDTVSLVITHFSSTIWLTLISSISISHGEKQKLSHWCFGIKMSNLTHETSGLIKWQHVEGEEGTTWKSIQNL